MLKLKELTKEDKLFFFERSWVTLDGLWMIETENNSDWETALRIDKIVWIRLLEIIFRRLQRYLGIETPTPSDVVKMLTFRWTIEGWDYEILINKETEIDIGIKTCPYKESMNRNPERRDKISLICKNMCFPFYKTIIENLNPNINFEITKSQGLGHKMCNFKFVFKDNIPKTNEELIYKEVSLDDKLFYYEKNWFTMDGLWMVEAEKELGNDLALKIDIAVWKRLYQIMFRRIKRYLKIEDDSINDLIKIFEFTWSCEGVEYEVINIEDSIARLNITICPFKAAMERNPERHERIEVICKDMCLPFFTPAIKDFNPKIQLERTKFMGLGDSICDYNFKLKK